MKNRTLQFLLSHLICISTQQLLAQPYGYGYSKEILIQEAAIPGTSGYNNFTILYKVVDPDLRLVANGGHVGTSTGYDILFYASGCLTQLDHQLEKYDPLTGELVAWVRIPYLSATANTAINIYYGNDTVSVNPSKASTWNSNYNGVWHLNEDPTGSAPQMKDHTGNGHDGSSFGGMTSGNSVAGIFGNGLSFDEVNDYIRIPDFLYGSELTVSFWFNLSEVNGTGYQYMFSHGVFSTQCNLNVYIGEDAISPPAEIPNRSMIKTNYRDTNDANNFDTLNAGNTYVDGNWHYYTMKVQDEGGATIYIDGVPRASYSIWGENLFDPVGSIYLGARQDLQVTRFYGGLLDEVRISSVWHSHDWIATEYSNQSNPAGFYTVSPEGPASNYCGILANNTVRLEVSKEPNAVLLQASSSYSANDTRYFIERSFDAVHWIRLQATANNSGKLIVRDSLYGAVVYYRTALLLPNGSVRYSTIQQVMPEQSDELLVYPNPVRNGQFDLLVPKKFWSGQITLYALSGKKHLQQQLGLYPNNHIVLPTGLPAGIYLIKLEKAAQVCYQKLIVQ